MVEKNWGKGTLALNLWSPWTVTWRRKGLYSGSWAARLPRATGLPPSATPFSSMSPPPDCRQSSAGLAAVRQRKGLYSRAARPLVHKILAMLWLEGSGEVGDNIHVPPSYVGCISHSKNHVQTFFKLCMRVGAPDTQNHSPNPMQEKCCLYNMSPLIFIKSQIVI
jgi:hypothetical protein